MRRRTDRLSLRLAPASGSTSGRYSRDATRRSDPAPRVARAERHTGGCLHLTVDVRFGLAQLYQLRGRVGRSHHQAYAYLLVDTEALTAQAKKRLEAIQSMEQLGSGLYIATHYLEL